MVSDNKNWAMGWQNSTNGQLLLQKGWPEFAEHYSIKIGQLLLFEHQGSSNFHIRIFNRNSCEITNFPFTKSFHLEKEIVRGAVNIELALKNGSRIRAYESDSRFCSSRVTAFCLRSYGLYLPITFARRCLTGGKKWGHCKLQTPDGRNWGLIQCNEYEKFGRIKSENWKKFCNDEHLAVGDRCVFELINEVKKVLKVTIIRAPG
ncbi:B3 domain-containing protein REM17-like [Rutidosis leptorrhynchoides]|uniref:B3 domain-containing protein REM17-like n=1 Tax=Rutidosis leptorrhynchoides TaxID=125765 RepID=UPI003A99A1B8